MATTLWKIDPAHSEIEFGVKHMMFTTVRGRFAEFEGTVELDREDAAQSKVEVDIDVASIDTGVEDRDGHLRSGDFFDVESHPKMTFRGKRVSGSLEAGGSLRIEGELTILDETRDVTLDATFEGRGTDPWGGERVGFSASTRIDRRDFGLTWNQALETGGVLVGHDVKIDLNVQAVLQEESAAVGA